MMPCLMVHRFRSSRGPLACIIELLAFQLTRRKDCSFRRGLKEVLPS